MAEISLRAESLRFNPNIPAERHLVEQLIEELIAVLDAVDPDPDMEEDDPAEDDLEDSCEAADDGCGPIWRHGYFRWGSEHDEEPLIPVYGLDQSHMVSWTHGPAPVVDLPCCGIIEVANPQI